MKTIENDPKPVIIYELSRLRGYLFIMVVITTYIVSLTGLIHILKITVIEFKKMVMRT